jgi:hypothetical protein
MDPYLESRWSDVHATLVAILKEALQPALPPSLRARSEERVLVEALEEEPSQYYRADVAVLDLGEKRSAGAAVAEAPVSAIEPVVIEYWRGPVVDRWIEIRDVSSGHKVVTAIEILSPWNKMPGRLNDDYIKKLDDYARGGVSVVEIDLLRHPRRGRLLVRDEDIPVHRRTPYVVCIRRAWADWRWVAYPIPLRSPLPAIPIPLRQTDTEIWIELQPLIDRVYAAGAHDDIDYSKPCEPPLTGEDAAWADELLKAAGKR